MKKIVSLFLCVLLFAQLMVVPRGRKVKKSDFSERTFNDMLNTR